MLNKYMLLIHFRLNLRFQDFATRIRYRFIEDTPRKKSSWRPDSAGLKQNLKSKASYCLGRLVPRDIVAGATK